MRINTQKRSPSIRSKWYLLSKSLYLCKFGTAVFFDVALNNKPENAGGV